MATMVASTPKSSNTRKRASLLRELYTNSPVNAATTMSSAMDVSIQQTNDELERSRRRVEVDQQRRLSEAQVQSSPGTPVNYANRQELMEQMQTCIKMHLENKINKNNAWNLKIIDMMQVMMRKAYGTEKESLPLGTSALDVSTKVYGIRVDDIHQQGLKLASTMTRLGNQEQGNDDGQEDQDNQQPGKKRKAKKKAMLSQRATIAKDEKNVLKPIVTSNSIQRKMASFGDMTIMSNLYSVRVPMNLWGNQLLLKSDGPSWLSSVVCNEKDAEKVISIKYDLPKKVNLCPQFSEFDFNDWQEDADESSFMRNATANELIYDDHGIPIPEMDGSIHDELHQDVEMEVDLSEDEHAVNQVCLPDTEVLNVADFRFREGPLTPNDYTYFTSNKSTMFNQVWAGPSHWKLKNIKPAIPVYMGKKEPAAAKRVKGSPVLANFSETPHILKNERKNSKRVKISHDPFRCTLPQRFDGDIDSPWMLLLKDVIPQAVNNEQTEIQVDTTYNYDNLRDSEYCSQNDAAGDDHFADDDEIVEEHMVNHGFDENGLGADYVGAPEAIPKSTIQYALKAKKMDMRKLKMGIWKLLVSPTDSTPNQTVVGGKEEVHPEQFSEILSTLRTTLPANMRSELSCPLAVVAVLHLANEHTLQLTGQEDRTDFRIESAKSNCI